MRVYDKTFLLGAATAAHQVEGNNRNSDSWLMESLPHTMYKEPSLEAIDHYHRYEEDIGLLKDAGLNAYRFSIEWARIQPRPDVWDDVEVEHYRKVLEYCHKTGVTPVVTMHHFTSPIWLITQGGWENPKTADLFAEYCAYIAKQLGDLMEYVCTINEANIGIQLADLMADMGEMMSSDIQVGINMPPSFDLEKYMMEMAEAFRCDPQHINTFTVPQTPECDNVIISAHEKARDAMKSVCAHLKIGITLSLHDIQAMPGGEDKAQKEWDNVFLHYLPAICNDDFIGVQNYTRKQVGPKGTIQPAADAPRTQKHMASNYNHNSCYFCIYWPIGILS
jgi:beta-glucosidase